MRGVVYFLHGAKHAIPLVVSLYSLRKHYQGDVALIATELASLPVFGISVDPMLRVTRTMQIPLMTAEAPTGNYTKGPGSFNRPMITKAALHRHTPFDVTLHLDADTLILDDPSLLLDIAEMCDCAVLPTRSVMNPERRENMVRFSGITGCEWAPQALPVNTGVMAYWKDDPLMEETLQLAIRGATAHRIADELAMQALYTKHPHVLVTDKWNWSPIYGTDPAPKIMHSPGCRMTLGKMRQPWLAHFKEVWDSDIASIRSWGGEEAKIWLSQLHATNFFLAFRPLI